MDWWLGSWLSGRQEGSEDRASRPQRLRNPGQGIAVLRSLVREISAVSGMTLMARNRKPSCFSFWKPLAWISMVASLPGSPPITSAQRLQPIVDPPH